MKVEKVSSPDEQTLGSTLRVLCIGAGKMGSQIGVEYALAGHTVTFLVRRIERSRASIGEVLAMVRRHGLATEEQSDDAAARIDLVNSHEAVDGRIDLVVESITEDFDLKVSALRPVSHSQPGAVMASNTSSLGIQALGDSIGAADRTIGTHYLNPPLLTPIVEVVPGTTTSASVVDFVADNLRAVGKLPIFVNREVPGFIWNRLQFALLREAIWLIENGIADAETVDEVIRLGLAPRWRTVPPIKSAALGGVHTFVRAAANILPALSDAEHLELLRDVAQVDAGESAELVRLRDETLAADRRRDRDLRQRQADADAQPGA